MKLQPEVGELGRNLFVSGGGSMVVASSCWQPNIELSLCLACEFFLLERKVPLSVALSWLMVCELRLLTADASVTLLLLLAFGETRVKSLLL